MKVKEFITIHVTNHSDGTKMDGIQSIGTTSLVNPICQKRKGCGGICAHCYADSLCKFRKSLNTALVDNFRKLTRRLLTPAEARAVPITSTIGRIESFGDVASVRQARNYLRIIKAHRGTQFGIWSKNDSIWLAAFRKEGKPKNCTYVHSSFGINKPDEVMPDMAEYVDHVFTVFDKTTYDQHFRGTPGECAGIQCRTCRKCYTPTTGKNAKKVPFHISERLR